MDQWNRRVGNSEKSLGGDRNFEALSLSAVFIPMWGWVTGLLGSTDRGRFSRRYEETKAVVMSIRRM